MRGPEGVANVKEVIKLHTVLALNVQEHIPVERSGRKYRIILKCSLRGQFRGYEVELRGSEQGSVAGSNEHEAFPVMYIVLVTVLSTGKTRRLK